MQLDLVMPLACADLMQGVLWQKAIFHEFVAVYQISYFL